MNREKGSLGVNYIVLAGIAILVLGVGSIMLTSSQGEFSENNEERTQDANCDTWVEDYKLASEDRREDIKQRYNDNCEGTISEVVDEEENFFDSDYNPDEHEEERSRRWPEPDVHSINEGNSESINEGGTVTYLGQDDDTLTNEMYVSYNPGSGASNTITGNTVYRNLQKSGGAGYACGGNTVTGLPMDQLPSGVSECAYSGIVYTPAGPQKVVICSASDSGNEITAGIGDPDQPASQICQGS